MHKENFHCCYFSLWPAEGSKWRSRLFSLISQKTCLPTNTLLIKATICIKDIFIVSVQLPHKINCTNNSPPVSVIILAPPPPLCHIWLLEETPDDIGVRVGMTGQRGYSGHYSVCVWVRERWLLSSTPLLVSHTTFCPDPSSTPAEDPGRGGGEV